MIRFTARVRWALLCMMVFLVPSGAKAVAAEPMASPAALALDNDDLLWMSDWPAAVKTSFQGTGKTGMRPNASGGYNPSLWLYRGAAAGQSRPVEVAGMAMADVVGEKGYFRQAAPRAGDRHYALDLKMDEPGHYNVYVTETRVRGDVRDVQIAKMQLGLRSRLGNDSQDPFSRDPISGSATDLELMQLRLPGQRTHRLLVGDGVRFAVRSHGQIVAGVPVTLISQTGWHKTEVSDATGEVGFVLMRDEIPDWKDVRRNNWATFLAVAETVTAGGGVHQGQPYASSRYRATLSLRCWPAAADYSSYAYGLGIILGVLVLCGAGVFIYRERRSHAYQEVRFDEKA